MTKMKQRGRAIETKFTPSCSILFMAELEGKNLEEIDNKPSLWWRYGNMRRKVKGLSGNPH